MPVKCFSYYHSNLHTCRFPVVGKHINYFLNSHEENLTKKCCFPHKLVVFPSQKNGVFWVTLSFSKLN